MHASLLVLAAVVLAVPALAQQTSLPSCVGDHAIVRVSTIKPGGSIGGFIAAAKAHQAWYRANGITDTRIIVAHVVVEDKATNAMRYSDSEVLSFHIRPPQQRPAHVGDAAWMAFVKQYQDNSEIKSEYITCMPNHSGR